MPFIVFYVSLYLLLAVSWKLSKCDVLSPNVLICASFIGAATMYILGSERLEAQTFTAKTTSYLLLGILVFILGSETCKVVVKSIKKYSDKRQYTAFVGDGIKPINLPIFFYVGFSALVIITTALQIYHVKQMVGGSIITALSIYRSETLLEGKSANSIVSLLSRVIYGIQPVLLFSMFYNKYIAKRKFRHPVLGGVAMVIYMMALYLISGSRGKVFAVFFQVLFAVTLTLNYGGNIFRDHFRSGEKKGNKFWIKAVVIIAVIGIPLFYYGGVIGGRNYSQISAFQSVENYFSYGLIRINLIVSKINTVASENWGQWSFPGIYSVLNKMNLIFTGSYDFFPFYKNYGNTVTIFGRWFVDFGLTGLVIMSYLSGLFYSYIYYRLKYTPSRKMAVRYSCLYIFLYSAIIMASYDDWVRSVMTLNGIFQIIILMFMENRVYKKYIKS